MSVFKAAVVGAGATGGEIAHTIASAEIPVLLSDPDPSRLKAGIDGARTLWQGLIDAGKLQPGELDRRLALIEAGTGYDGFGGVDFVIEAMPEQLELKRELFAQLDQATPGHAILASNTSTVSITEIGEATSRPDKVVGFHFVRLPSAARVIEVIEGDDTSPETMQAAANFAQAIRRTPIHSRDSPGFVVNRILFAALSELWRYQQDSGISIEELDASIAESKAAPMGPFFLADLLGLDSVMRLTEHLRECHGDRFEIPERMRELVAAGDLGATSGRGFYEHRS